MYSTIKTLLGFLKCLWRVQRPLMGSSKKTQRSEWKNLNLRLTTGSSTKRTSSLKILQLAVILFSIKKKNLEPGVLQF